MSSKWWGVLAPALGMAACAVDGNERVAPWDPIKTGRKTTGTSGKQIHRKRAKKAKRGRRANRSTSPKNGVNE